MKKILFAALLLVGTVAARAQFEAGTKYVGASLSNFGLSYSDDEKFRLGVELTGGYFLWDDIMLKANLNYEHKQHSDNISIGLGGRYYFRENGIFLGAGAEYCHETHDYNDLRIPVEVGYCFYLNKYVSLEPAAYYRMSINDFSKKSAVGLKVGFGFYF